MKFKLSTIFISVFLAGLLLYGFVSLSSSDPYGDYAPGTETSITTNNGNTADTTVPGNWPYATVWNWNYRGISGVNGGTVGCCYYADHYFSNRWNSSTCYLYDNTGTNGGPGTQTSSPSYTGSIRDMTIGQDNSGSDFLYGGKGSSTLYKLGANAQTITQYSIGGAQIRAIAWDPNRKGFWVCNWHTAINCYDTTGTLIDSYAGGSALAAKYGLGWDSGYAHVDTATLFVWHQTPGQTMSEVNLSTKTVIRSFLISAGTHIAGGAESYKSSVNNDIWLVLNYQNYANVAYKIGTGGVVPNPGFPESFEGTTFPPAGWGKFNVGGGTGWKRLTVGTSPIPGWTGGVITAPPGGENAVAFCTWNTGGTTSNDQYLYTPQISGVNITDADSITYWLKRTFKSYADTVELRVSTTTPTAGGFTNLLRTHGYPASGSDTNWVRFAASLSSFAGQNIYIAWREKVADNYNNGAAISLDLVDIAGTITGVTNNQTPGAYDLAQNYPNPFNPTTTINFSIQKQGLVTLKVYDILGKEVATLVNDPKVAGSYSVNFNGENLSSGVYFYRLEANDFVSVKRMLLLK